MYKISSLSHYESQILWELLDFLSKIHRPGMHGPDLNILLIFDSTVLSTKCLGLTNMQMKKKKMSLEVPPNPIGRLKLQHQGKRAFPRRQ